ncbi:hypothetical protein [Micropruina glycogenica]|uniref:4Fe-4S Wbl-type domain-containing protein n=1 Tax=Micropruina glycogenica TaxID=75385 RepID=A0A2N9JJK8_9ACTN|nr:hypothetical protein [Micropruina glycogenica]SPD87763.1 protein of unknown function [Micropruina glycogenica]
MNIITIRTTGPGSLRARQYMAANLVGWMETANCRNLGWLWNAAEDHQAHNAGDPDSQHAAQAALEICIGCPAFSQCRTWATYDQYSGLASGQYWTNGRPSGERPAPPIAPATPRLSNSRLLRRPVHAASRPTDSEDAGDTGRPAGAAEDEIIAAYFLIPVRTKLPLASDASYAFLDDVGHLEYVLARRADPALDIDQLRSRSVRREASLWIHRFATKKNHWKTVVTTALPWLPTAAIEALPTTNTQVACVIEACVLVETESLWPTAPEILTALNHAIDCVRQLQSLAARTAGRHVARLTRASLPQWIGVAVTKLHGYGPPAAGHFWLLNTRTCEGAGSLDPLGRPN